MIGPDSLSFPVASRRTAGYMPVFGQEKPPAGLMKAGVGGAEKSAAFAPVYAEKPAPDGDSGFIAFLKGVIDIVNPLQHIPVVSAIYRHVTGDEIAPMARIAGDALYGGPLGAAVGMADVALEKTTGRDMGETAFALLGGGKGQDAPVMVAQHAPYAVSEIVWNAPPEEPAPQAVPREMMARQMMDALDKYGAMKRAEYAPSSVAGSF